MLGPPLEFLPQLEPEELRAYRQDYQAFRAGHHVGAHGEITGLRRGRQKSEVDGEQAEAYFSEPEPREPSANPREAPALALRFWSWLGGEAASRAKPPSLEALPRNHLLEVAKVPPRLEKVLAFGFLLCLDILLHELSFTPLQVLRGLGGHCRRAWRGARGSLSATERCDVLRVALFALNVVLLKACFSNSRVYHYIRGESFLKLYVLFNMLELAERWLRSVGVDFFELLVASERSGGFPWKFLAVLVYCFLHSSMHMVRIQLLTVAINTSSSAMFLIIVTNNFGEIKSTVFKRYEAKSLFPIVTSDIVERFYLVLDIIFVLLRLGASTRRAAYVDIAQWLLLLVGIELGTDWVKFCLIMKFSELPAAVLESYYQVLLADVLVCRMPKREGPALKVPFRGIQSFSHAATAKRVGFSALPLSSLVLLHLPLGSPLGILAVLVFLILALLAKVLLGICVLGFAARRRQKLAKGLELFGKVRAL
ncbi:unnamed protein product [Effrenium voratum]|uniref:Uncharacterized protein n=1 Tax=Effrenium voratum TaxID=2562239 RepID=A0AA36JEZ8_9DINO|nr:unnamed protein product [Effrenium voratum]